eukprot:546199_1
MINRRFLLLLLLLFHQFYVSYCSITSVSSYQPSTLEVTGECNNPAVAKSRYDYISLLTCIELCEKDDCVMIQYYDKLQSDSDSRCYIFDDLCDLSQNVGKRVNSSHIYYKNQFSTNYCVDYRDWEDKYLDNCNAYVTHGLCLNGKMTEKATVDRFEQAKWTDSNNALEACCACGGGISVFDNVAVTYINKNNFNDAPQECSFKDDINSTTSLAQWNNFALNQLMEGINYPLNGDVFIYKHLSNIDSSTSYTLSICNFSSYNINATPHDIYTDFFIFAAIEYIEVEEYIYFVNSEYFNLDLNVMSSVLEVQYYGYQDCNNLILNASLDDHSVIDMILPCFKHSTPPTSVSTLTPQIETTEVTEPTELTVQVNQTQSNTEQIEIFLDIYGYYTINENNWIYVTTACAALCVFITFCLFCCIRKCKKKKRKKKKNELQTLQTLSKHGQVSKHHKVPTHEPDDSFTIDGIDSESDVKEGSRSNIDEQIIISMEKKHGTLYLQDEHYDEHQVTNIENRWSNTPEKGPKLVFGDNIVDKKRSEGVKRKQFANQCLTVGHVDRTFGFGIPTTFKNAESVGFIYNEHNYRNELKFEFDILKQHLLNGGDVIIPYPSADDIRKKPHKYKQNGKGKQIIHHNIGTGNSKLAFKYLYAIEEHINSLKEVAYKTEHVDKVLYDDDNEYETDEKEELIKDNKKGLLVFQKAWYNDEQMAYIFNVHYERYKRVGSTLLAQPTKMLFGDNDVDNRRGKNVKRLYSAGQAKIMGPYDRSLAYGIITTFYKLKLDKGEFMKLMDEQFKYLQKHLWNGNDVVVPKPPKKDVLQNKNRYCNNGTQMIFHNIGTGIAQLPFDYIQYIQYKIDELHKYASGTKTVKYYSYSKGKTSKSKSQKIKEEIISIKCKIQNNVPKMYKCSWCAYEVHYIIKYKNCKHSSCEGCLAGLIIDHLNYADNTEEYRFRCWAGKTGKCPNGIICLEDVRIPDDKCYCDECKHNNTDTGNGTILDDESYKQFEYIWDAFSTKSPDDTDVCPNSTCKKLFKIDRPWRYKQDKVTNGYYYGREISFFDDIVINENECNCCGKTLTNELLKIMDDDFDDLEEIGTTAYQSINNCRICHQYYCDNCRSNCFYEIEREYTVRPPTPVNDVMMKFHVQRKLKKAAMKNDEFELEQKSEIKKEAFECCEICWYRFYCRECPHCQHKFCGMCDGKWNGCTANWTDKAQNFHPDDEKYEVDNINTNIDEKHGKHDSKGHHICGEKLKLQKKAEQLQMKREEMAHRKMKIMEGKLKDKLSEIVEKQGEIVEKDKTIKKLQNANNQQRLARTEKDAKIKELENEILKLEKKKLKDELEVKEKDVKELKKNIFELNQFRKKISVNVWKWKQNEKWISYDEDINRKIEALNIGESLTFHRPENNKQKNYKITKISECKGSQQNTETQYKRNIERFVVTGEYIIQYPKFWNNGCDLDYAEPSLIKLNIHESPAKEVANAFYATSKSKYNKYKNIKIICIESVQNQRLYDKYWMQRNVLKREIGEGMLNEKYLWHGTTVLDLIQKEGFRREFNNRALWGEG